jgi:hypothetical protein
MLELGSVSAAKLNRQSADHNVKQTPHKAPADNGERINNHTLRHDHSRYVVALEIFERAREVDMLEQFVRALRRPDHPESVCFDDGPTFTGEALGVDAR